MLYKKILFDANNISTSVSISGAISANQATDADTYDVDDSTTGYYKKNPTTGAVTPALETDLLGAVDSYTKDKRRRSYPTVGDQLDAIWKYLATLDLTSHTDTKAISDAITTIKTDNPLV